MFECDKYCGLLWLVTSVAMGSATCFRMSRGGRKGRRVGGVEGRGNEGEQGFELVVINVTFISNLKLFMHTDVSNKDVQQTAHCFTNW